MLIHPAFLANGVTLNGPATAGTVGEVLSLVSPGTLGFVTIDLSGYATTSSLTAAFIAHLAALDPHPQYLTQTEGDGRYPLISAGLAQFALNSTSSDELRALLSDETGTGAAVFGTGPTFNGLSSISPDVLTPAVTIRTIVSQGNTPALQVLGTNGTTVLGAWGSDGSIVAAGGALLLSSPGGEGTIAGVTNAALRLSGQSRVSLIVSGSDTFSALSTGGSVSSSGRYAWSSTSSPFGPASTSLTQLAGGGGVQINNVTGGTLGDLSLRNLAASELRTTSWDHRLINPDFAGEWASIDTRGGLNITHTKPGSTVALNALGNVVLARNGTWKLVLGASTIGMASDLVFAFSSNVNGNGTPDLGYTRSAAGVLQLTNASTGNGALICGSPDVLTAGLTVRTVASQGSTPAIRIRNTGNSADLTWFSATGALYVGASAPTGYGEGVSTSGNLIATGRVQVVNGWNIGIAVGGQRQIGLIGQYFEFGGSTGQSAPGVFFNTTTDWTPSGQALVEFRNNGTPVFSVTPGGAISIPNCPTTDPGVPGRVWRDGTTLKISV